MIEKFAHAFQEKGMDALREQYKKDAPGSYDAIFTDVVKFLNGISDYYEAPDPDRITVIDHGDYQGTRVFVVAATGYQPWTYYVCKVGYGSCSGCDTFEAIRGYRYDDGPTPDEEVEGYVTLALHMVQSMKEV